MSFPWRIARSLLCVGKRWEITVVGLRLETAGMACAIAMGIGIGTLHGAEARANTGTVSGTVVDVSTFRPVAGAVVAVPSRNVVDTTDGAGAFSLADIGVGNVSLSVTAPGYVRQLYPDVTIKSGVNAPKRFEIAAAVLELDTMVVRAHRVRSRAPEQSTSVIRMTRDEVFNSPGSSQDIGRVLQTLPAAVGGADDNWNGFLVRGGSMEENVFLLDGVPVVNLGHWGDESNPQGTISFLHLDFVRSLDFYAGGFPARFPPRLSSVVDVGLREGSMTDRRWQVDMNMAGAGVLAEGPIVRKISSYMVSGRVSFLDLIEPFLDIGGIPQYQNGQVKLVHDLSSRDRLTLNGLVSNESLVFTRGEAHELTTRGRRGIGGLQWRRLPPWGMNTLTLSGIYGQSHDFETVVDSLHTFDFETRREQIRLNNDVRLFVRDNDVLDIGAVVAREEYHGVYRQDEYYRWARPDSQYEYTTGPPDPSETIAVVDSSSSVRERSGEPGYHVGVYAGYTWHRGRLKVNLGLRDDYYTLLRAHGPSPRGAVSLGSGARGTLSLSGAMLYQFPYYLYRNELVSDYPDRLSKYELQRGYQAVAGYETQLGDVVIAGAESFYKYYDREPSFALDRDSAKLIVTVDPDHYGRKRARGIELYVRKKRRDRLYYELAYTLYSVVRRYRDGRWYDDENNLRNSSTVILGSNFHKNHGISLRCHVTEGRPYAPIDVDLSEQAYRTVYDMSGEWYGRRRKPRAKLSLRYTSTRYFSWGNLTSYLEMLNILNQRDVVLEYFTSGDKLSEMQVARYRSRGFMFVGGATLDF